MNPYALERTLQLTEITNALAFSPDGVTLAVATRAKTGSTSLVNLADGSLGAAPRFVRHDLAFARDGALVVAGTKVERYAVGGAKLARASWSVPGHPRGITRVALSPDGRWVAVLAHLEALTLWRVDGATPMRTWSMPTHGAGRFFFTPDGGRLQVAVAAFVAGHTAYELHDLRLDDGAAPTVTKTPLHEGLHPLDPMHATPHGLAALPLGAHAVSVFPWAGGTPRTVALDTLRGVGLRMTTALAPDGDHLVVQSYRDDAHTRSWFLTVVSLARMAAVAVAPLGAESAALLALAPGATRIAYLTSRGDRSVYVLRRRDAADAG